MKCPHCQAENREGAEFCRKCGRSLVTEIFCPKCGHSNLLDSEFCDKCGHFLSEPAPTKPPSAIPTSFANGRYQVKKFLGEGGKKKVYLAHDTVLDRDVAFYLIKTEKLDESARTRIKREAQAMGKLGDHPNIMSIFDFGDHEGQPYMVAPLMAGGDVEGLIEKATDHKLPLDKAIEIARSVCKGLEFAHAKGVIHRDIKPGNIWMSADGTVKIGDFGLSVAVDLSRLTQEGMMVGTVSYMPPEQAMGGTVTAKADLYSLGAMLYEMVTGRPPFVGDDSVAIIGQHINTSPISPSWHRADLPPALETLIMQLLEKNSEKRPASATVVLHALEAIGSGKVGKEPAQKAEPAENPLYRRVFVGRERELKQLQSAFDGAISGQGALMMVVGEPGIGKTAICEQLATYVTLRGGKTLWGHCYEEGSLSLPYLAFVEAMRSYVLDREPDDLRKELGSGATDVARIVSEIREKLKVEPRKAENPEEDRYRLMQAVTSFLSHAADVKPMLVILEDLHDADKGTLEMLSYVSRNLGGTRLLLVGTYRDVEVDRNHPLSAALAELRRVSSFGRVLLRGLNIDEVRRMLESLTQDNIPVGLAEAVHRQTEGNPLFVQEVVRYLTEEKLLTRSGGKISTASTTSLEMNIPEGLRDVIGKRLTLLSPECNQLLTIAAVIGREFRLDVVQKVSTFSDEELFSLLEEARRAAIIEERARVGVGVTYRFTHAFFRQTLYEETIAPRRIRLHLQIGQALEEIYSKRLEEHASELSDHFSHSSDSDDLKKAVRYGEIAAIRAMNVYAYGEAVHLLEQAIEIQDIVAPDDKAKKSELLLGLCEAVYHTGDLNRVIDTIAPAALFLAEELEDDAKAASVCVWAMLSIAIREMSYNNPQLVEWANRADRHAKPGTPERAYIDAIIGTSKLQTLDSASRKEGYKLLSQAVDLARNLNDNNPLWYAAPCFMMAAQIPQYFSEQTNLAEELRLRSRTGLILTNLLMGLDLTGEVFLMMGQRERTEEAWGELHRIVERTGNTMWEILTAGTDLCLLCIDGRFEETLAMSEQLMVRGQETGFTTLALVETSLALYRSHYYLGTMPADVENRIAGFRAAPGFSAKALLANVLAHQGKNDEVKEILEWSVVNRPDVGTDEDMMPIWIDALYLESAVLAGHQRSAELLMNRFKGTGIYTSGSNSPKCVLRHMGEAAVLLGKHGEAREYYKEAIRVCTEMRFRPELALSRLDLAELLLDHYPDEKKQALEHLDFAIKEFREMKMQPSLERALRRKKILKA